MKIGESHVCRTIHYDAARYLENKSSSIRFNDSLYYPCINYPK
ncbi:hypothetical protein APCEc03_027 [Escherichia phage phiAPCEc03]|uniref:Uncharacterized protein n=3 Tax=Tequintavirus TaxID=187218 RepID=A0A0U2DA21_9CAUD|nr:hypothetical protein HOR05_gp126 [Escherichia phage phiAPCEc03]AKO61428.1 hypothetical protein APCEc03_027 [Escherichia phage phiAPCEc03]QEI25721.1 hypothetical protein [Salmonella phage SE8]UDL14091.1 hypothetical protein [Salmonella phage vB_SenS_S124]